MMDQSTIVELLRSVPLFSSLSDHDLTQVADRMKEVHFSEGTAVAKQGETGVGFHLVVDGTAEVSKDGATLTELGRGGYFGEIGLIDGGPRSATVTATTDLNTVSLVGWDFTPLLDNPSFTKGLLMGLCRIARQERGE
jgi:CRP/FNR family transcriptional regulator, cyclic AMP receptor protein